MLIGRVRSVGPGFPGPLRPGDRIATLVSLTLTPLALEAIERVHVALDRVDVRGHAILFESGVYALLPPDLPDTLSLAALDVCGAPAHTARLARAGETVLVLGAGKSGALCCAQARRAGATVIALDVSAEAVARLQAAGLVHHGLVADARRPVEVLQAVQARTGGKGADLVINCASVPGTEMASILAARDRGTVLFFSMATSFTAAALGAEGVGKDVDLLVGNGYAAGHAALTLDLLRSDPGLRRLFEERYGGRP
jgi:L-erythro-3,5-diaminohexanoate dehydrogenase